MAFAVVILGCAEGESNSEEQIPEATTSVVNQGSSSSLPTTSAVEDQTTTEDQTTIAATRAATSTTGASTSTSEVPATPRYQVPVRDDAAAGWGTTHAGYPATDVFASCGAEIVSPVNGIALEVRTVDGWDPSVDDPATRGGRSIALVGDDGVRYYMAHFETIDPAIAVGRRVGIGEFLGTVGQTGRASACHVHFGISPPCPTAEWSVRRGAIWPHPYLDAWRSGEQWSPVEEVERWVTDNPTACADAAAVNAG